MNIMMSKVILATTLFSNVIRLSHAFHHPTTSTTTRYPFTRSLPRVHSLSSTTDTTTTNTNEPPIEKSTLTLLEHVNVNIPSQTPSLTFYCDILGLGLDPRRAQNAMKGSGTLWANCGASQFHLPYGDVAQRIPGSTGLVYDSLKPLKERLERGDEGWRGECYKGFEVGVDAVSKREYVKIEDVYGNIFFCRQSTSVDTDDDMHRLRQPVVSPTDKDFGFIAESYGKSESECRGIEYVEFYVPKNTAATIAQFYEYTFDAPTTALPNKENQIAIVGFGTIHPTGQCSQSLIFRETDDSSLLPTHYDGHHIALYVGQNAADFEQAFRNCDTAGIVWVNPRFSDKATDLGGARKWQQFRFKDIIDLKTGERVLELEHEVRCVGHVAWPGGRD